MLKLDECYDRAAGRRTSFQDGIESAKDSANELLFFSLTRRLNVALKFETVKFVFLMQHCAFVN